jgi:methionine-rich copper-binding protein CopC
MAGRIASLLLILLCLAAPVIVAPGAAHAHAVILSSSPAVNAAVTGPIVPITLRFNSRIDAARSIITLIDSGNSQTPLHILPASSSDTLLAATGALPPGAYRIRWQVLSVDGHITRGDIPFTVAPSPVEPAPTP